MIRQVLAASATLIALVARPLAPPAAAGEGQTLLIDSGRMRCLVSLVCQRTDGLAFAQSVFAASKYNEHLPLAVKRGTGEFYYAKGSVAASGETSIGNGQTLNLYGWTIQNQGLRTRFANDASGHGFYVNQADINQF